MSSSLLRPYTVGPAILAPFTCRIGSTAPSRRGFKNAGSFHEPDNGPVSASPSPITQATTRFG